MKRILFIGLFTCSFFLSIAQVAMDYDPSKQQTTHLQFFKPIEEHLFVGDCMPYYHGNTFYLYWLIDQGHHSGLGGLGGHQWALSTSTDLKNWKHYPIALGIDEEWEKSICTGSVIAEGDKFHAFYATRIKDESGVKEQLSYAISSDGGLSFKKQKPNPFYFPPEVSNPNDFRDPEVFKDKDGLFHLFISTYLKEPVLNGFGGYLAHLISKDLKNWEQAESPLTGQQGTPECPDYFRWGDWYYLVYQKYSETFYVKSKNPYGPWEYPETQALVEEWSNVAKTAEFTGNRRVSVSFIPGRGNNNDRGGEIYAGNLLFREVLQSEDGTLSTRFLPEVLPASTPIVTPAITTALPEIISINGKQIQINAQGSMGVANMNDLPDNYRIRMKIIPESNYEILGLYLRGHDKNNAGYKLELNANNATVMLHNTSIHGVKGLREPVQLDIIVFDDFIDVCINNQRCIVNRLPEKKGHSLFFYVKNGIASIENIEVSKI